MDRSNIDPEGWDWLGWVEFIYPFIIGGTIVAICIYAGIKGG